MYYDGISKGDNKMADKEGTTTKAPKVASISAYRKAKLKILKRDFLISLTATEIERANTLKTEVAIDQFCLGILNSRWG
jgi:hypothetical protein